MRKIIPVLILFFLIAACENPITFVWDVRVETDSETYTFPETVTVSINNESENPVDIRLCDGDPYYELQRQVGVEWQAVIVTDCPGDEIFESLTVGQNRMFSIDLSIIEDEEEVAGTYRLKVVVYPDGERIVRLPESMRISNTFIVSESE